MTNTPCTCTCAVLKGFAFSKQSLHVRHPPVGSSCYTRHTVCSISNHCSQDIRPSFLEYLKEQVLLVFISWAFTTGSIQGSFLNYHHATMAPIELMAASKMRTWTSRSLWWISRILINRVKICGHRKTWNGTKATMPPNQQEEEWTRAPASFSPEAFFKTSMNSVLKAGGQAWRGGLVKSAYEFWVLPDHTRWFTNACNSRSGGSDTPGL